MIINRLPSEHDEKSMKTEKKRVNMYANDNWLHLEKENQELDCCVYLSEFAPEMIMISLRSVSGLRNFKKSTAMKDEHVCDMFPNLKGPSSVTQCTVQQWELC